MAAEREASATPAEAARPAAAESVGELRPWLAFSACGAIWGSTFMVISIGNDALAPVWAATLRLVLATVLLTVWSLARGEALPRGAALRAALAYGVLQFGLNFPLLYWGEKTVPSGLSAVLYATLPMTSAFLTRAFGMERLTLPKLVGSVTAFAGVAVLFSSSFHLGASSLAAPAQISAAGFLAVFAAATLSGGGNIVLKLGPRQKPIGANAAGCAIGAAISAVVSFAMREPHPLPATAATLGPLLYLTIAGSMGAFVLMSWLVNHWTVTRVSYISVVVPVIALALGSLVRHEPVTQRNLAGAALVLVGLLIGMRRPAAATNLR